MEQRKMAQKAVPQSRIRQDSTGIPRILLLIHFGVQLYFEILHKS